MKEKMSRKLDISAKLFPLLICKKYNGVFRIAFTLSNDVNEQLLQMATMKTLEEMPFFKVKLKIGFFWHYIGVNNNSVIINKATKKFCNKINFKENNDYLFNITYIGNKVNVDILHYLCDGMSGKVFVGRILDNYLFLIKKQKKVLKNKLNYTDKDDYIKNYNQNIKLINEKVSSKNVYKIKGELLPNNDIDVTKININLKKLKKEAKNKQCSVTEYLCAFLIYSIKKNNAYKNGTDKIVRVCVPIDLRSYFNSSTLQNFFSYMYVESDNSELDSIIIDVKKQFKKNLEHKSVQNKINQVVALGTNKIIEKIPLALKRIIVQMVYWKIANNSTLILSNFGNFNSIENVEDFETIIEPDPTKLTKCCFCSYNDRLSLIFSSKIKEKHIEKVFWQEIQVMKLDD